MKRLTVSRTREMMELGLSRNNLSRLGEKKLSSETSLRLWRLSTKMWDDRTTVLMNILRSIQEELRRVA